MKKRKGFIKAIISRVKRVQYFIDTLKMGSFHYHVDLGSKNNPF